MDQNQQELRRIANEAFMQSLGQLEETLNLPETLPQAAKRPNEPPDRIQTALDLQALEAAAADIEQAKQTPAKQTPAKEVD